MDTNVGFTNTLRVVDRLIAADKDFELVIVPRADHVYLGYDHYLYQRRWDFLVRELMGVEPPAHRIKPLPFDEDLFADWI